MEWKDELAALNARIEASQLDTAAQMSALQFLVEVLLANFIAKLDETDRAGFVDALMTVGRRTGHLKASTETEAVAMADLAVLTQERIAAIVQRAQDRARSG